MALDPHPDREPGMDARIVHRQPTYQGRERVLEWAKSAEDGKWYGVELRGQGWDWDALAISQYSDATVVLP